MYFWSYVLRRMWFDKCWKWPVSENPSRVNMLSLLKYHWNLRDTAEICMIALICHIFQSFWEIESGKNVSDSDMWDLMTVSKHIDCWCKYSFRYRESFPQLGQMELSKNQTNFSEFVAAFLTSPSNSKYFEKKMAFLGHVFPKLRIVKDI